MVDKTLITTINFVLSIKLVAALVCAKEILIESRENNNPKTNLYIMIRHFFEVINCIALKWKLSNSQYLKSQKLLHKILGAWCYLDHKY